MKILIISFATCLLVFLILFLLRNLLIYSIRGKAIKIAQRNAEQAIRWRNPNWLKYWEECENGESYEYMVFCQLHKWTFKQFYPDLK